MPTRALPQASGMTAAHDPFEAVLLPPPNENEQERVARLSQEAEATRVSEEIDAAIRSERQKQKKRRIVRVLLLGQSESGKSTVLRQFQRLYTPSAFREERALWRSVIYLNLARSVRIILDTITHVLRGRASRVDSGGDDIDSDPDNGDQLGPLDGLRALVARLEPVRRVEAALAARLVPSDEEEPTHLGVDELFVRPGAGWKGLVARGARAFGSESNGRPSSKGTGYASTVATNGGDEAAARLYACLEDMLALWAHPTTREILKRRKVKIEESPGFFLNDLRRICAPNYFPSEDDVLRARLKTVGVSEYKFEMEAPAGRDAGNEWRLIDVGGSRSLVSTWVPFFDNVDAIIFMAPISGFDQVLVEDRSVNRLEDSVLIWKAVCSNKLLANVELVLFLNKCDILERKLASGVKLAKYVRSYGDRPNDLENASKYFRGKFGAIQREYSPNPRKFYGFCTSVTDTTTTSGILASVRDMVVRQHLQRTKLL